MIGQGHELARLQSDFHRDNYYKMLKLLVIEIGVMLVLIAAIIYVVFFQQAPPYYATTTEGKIIQLQAAT